MVHSDAGALGLPAIVIHGGAGEFSALRTEEAERVLVDAMRDATGAGYEVLAAGGSALDAVVEAVASLEDSGRFNAGRGAVATADGAFEFDASVMDGATGAVGALCAASFPANPVRAARAIADSGGVPDGPVLLAGLGADRFCEEHGLDKMRAEWLGKRPSTEDSPKAGARSEQGTVGAVAVDSSGGVAAATSTGGRAGQLRGRVGDSPIPGAGVLAHRAGVAVSATGAGEAFLVAGFAHRVAWSIERGRDLPASLEGALSEVSRLGGTGGAISLSPSGEFAAAFSSRAMARAWQSKQAFTARLGPSGE